MTAPTPQSLVIGTGVMVSTGLLLLFPILATRFLPGELIPVAKVGYGFGLGFGQGSGEPEEEGEQALAGEGGGGAEGEPVAWSSAYDYAYMGSDGLWRDVLARVDVFFVSEEELKLPGLRHDPAGTLARLAGGRLRHVLLKRGAAGGVLYDTQTHELTGWAPRATELVDPTGAGDAFAGGFLAARLAGESVAGALERGVVSASFALETWGAAGLITATASAARRRRAEWFGGGDEG